MEKLGQSVDGEVISINIRLYEIEICYIHSTSDQNAGLIAKHTIHWYAGKKNWLKLQLEDVQKRLIGSRISNFDLGSSKAQFQIGDELVEVVQDGPTEYLELWWEEGSSTRRSYF